MNTIYQSKKLKQDRGNYKIVTGNYLGYSPLQGDTPKALSSLKPKVQSLKLILNLKIYSSF